MKNTKSQLFVSKLLAGYIEWDKLMPDDPQRLRFSYTDIKDDLGWVRITKVRITQIIQFCVNYGISCKPLETGINFTLDKKSLVVNYKDFALKSKDVDNG